MGGEEREGKRVEGTKASVLERATAQAGGPVARPTRERITPARLPERTQAFSWSLRTWICR